MTAAAEVAADDDDDNDDRTLCPSDFLTGD